MRCPNPSCGEENPASATHCEVCGAALSAAPVKRRTSLEPAPVLPGGPSPAGFPGLSPGKRRETKFEALPDLPLPGAPPGPPVFQPGGPAAPPAYQQPGGPSGGYPGYQGSSGPPVYQPPGPPVFQGTPAPAPAAPPAAPQAPPGHPSAAAYSVPAAYPPAAPYPSAFGQAPPIAAPAPARPFDPTTAVSPVDALLRGLAPAPGATPGPPQARAPAEERSSFPSLTGGRMAATTLAVAPDLGGPSPVRAVLFEYRGQGHPGSVHVLRAGRNVLGRDAGVCDVVLDDDRASKQHAFLFIRGDEASFIDVSSNGTTVDGRSVFGTEAKLQQHSTIDIGATRLVFVIVPERLIDGPR